MNRRAQKLAGRYYTPPKIVAQILDLAGYSGPGVARRQVLENSCGDGAFLGEIVERYCRERTRAGLDAPALRAELETFVHGVELDPTEAAKCVRKLDAISLKYGVSGVRWDVSVADALEVDRFDGRIDFVLGNPPYVRVHNLGASFAAVKRFGVAKSGMTDLFLVFYELGLRALAPGGTLGFVTPNSFFGSVAGENLRRRLVDERLLTKLVDLKWFRAFDDATTYSAIVVLKKNRPDSPKNGSTGRSNVPALAAPALAFAESDASDADSPVPDVDSAAPDSDFVDYFEYDGEPRFVDRLSLADFLFDGRFYFGTRRNLAKLREILRRGVGSRFAVKNGFATLADKIFLSPNGFPFDERVIPAVKASTGREVRCFFPYDANGKLLSFEELTKNAEIGRYLAENAAALKRRALTNASEWFGFGRSQGIKDVFAEKIAVNALIRGPGDVKLTPCPPGTGVYGGLYITTRVPFADVRAALVSDEFAEYVRTLGKCKSGGYCAFSSKELKTFLEYKFVEK